jgi:hypothetical protein
MLDTIARNLFLNLFLKKPSIFILGYLLEFIIKIWLFGIYLFFHLKSDKFGPFFFHEKSFLYKLKSFFFLRQKLMKFRPIKRKHCTLPNLELQ